MKCQAGKSGNPLNWNRDSMCNNEAVYKVIPADIADQEDVVAHLCEDHTATVQVFWFMTDESPLLVELI